MIQTSYYISEKVYDLLYVDALRSIINGDVYRESVPSSIEQAKETEDVVIIPLVSIGDFVQTHTINVNVHVPDLSDGSLNIDRINAISKIVLQLLTANQSANEYVYVEFVQQTSVRSMDDRTYSNIRIKVITLKP